ncbi:hypothetical protein ACGFOU_30160 [Streptomyces sp. NPDC048595]|uniref:hypothetical protein n=1 Tax=Streptomyces sp. NPDC048595 TaxID=3365576 RepID=UPI003713F5DC
MNAIRRSAAMTLLLLLAVAFGPLLCRAGGDQPREGVRAAGAERVWHAAAQQGRAVDGPADAPVADAPKRCSDRHAPGPEESAPPPAPHRGEPLAPATAGAGPLAVDLPAQFALARPPTDGTSAVDHTALLPVLRI